MFIQKPFSLTTSTGSSDSVYVPKGAIWTNGTDEYLSFTPSGTGNNKKFTISTWLKQIEIAPGSGNHPGLFGAWSNSTNRGQFYFDDGGYITFFNDVGGSRHTNISTASTYRRERDPTGWMHLFLAIDSTPANPGPANIYMTINGEVITPLATATYPSQNSTYQWCTSGVTMTVGAGGIGGSYEMYGAYYLSDTILLDGYAAIPSDFARYDSNGVWVPKDPTDIVTTNKGTNGFWLDYADSSDLGNDVSGNNNDFTAHNLTSSNATADRPADEAPDTGNYCNLNSAYREGSGYNLSLSNGNLTYSNASHGLVTSAIGTFPMKSGKWYWEVTLGATTSDMSTRIGIAQVDDRAVNPDGSVSQYLGRTAGSWSFAAWGAYSNAGKKETNATWADYLNATSTTGDIISVAFDADNGAIWIAKNNSWVDGSRTGQSSATVLASIETYANTYVMFDGLTDGPYLPVFTFDGTNGTATTNFGQTAFNYTPPSGFKKLNTSNMSAPAVSKSSDSFLPMIYEGNGTGQRVGNFIPFTDSHTVSNSARFDVGGSDYLSRTPSSNGSQTTWTHSLWIKRGILDGNFASIVTGYADASNYIWLMATDNTNALHFQNIDGGGYAGQYKTNQVFENTQTWTHLVAVWDTASGGASADLQRFYVNGVRVTDWATSNAPSASQVSEINSTSHSHQINAYNGTQFGDGYLSEVIFVDGYALDPSVFGQTDTSTGRWIPKEVTAATLNAAGGGSSGFGTNGFYLPFSDKTAYGLDISQGASAALDAQTLFLANFDGSDAATSATDSSNFSHTITFAGNAQLDTAIKKFGTAALLLDGSGDYVSMASFPPLAGSSFCIEGWAYLTDGSGTQLAFIGNRDGGSDDDSWLINIGGTAKRMSVRTDNTEVMASNTDITLNTWTHIAYTWDGTTNRLFQAGALVASSTSFTPAYSDVNTLYIGHDGRGTTNDWPGSIDEVRVVKGSAVHTSTFSPPTSAYSAPAAGNMFVPFNLDQTYGSNQMYGTPTRNTAVQNNPQSNASLSLGNLQTTQTASGSGNWGRSRSTLPLPDSSKIYLEGYVDEIGNAMCFGLIGEAEAWSSGDGGFTGVNALTMYTYNSGWATSYVYAQNKAVFSQAAVLFATGSWIQMAIDTSAKKLWFGVNNSWFDSSGGTTGNPSTGANPTITYSLDGDLYPAVWMYYGSPYSQPYVTLNYGQWEYLGNSALSLHTDAGGYFEYTPPTDYKALTQDNLEANTAGITGFSWIKNRDAADNHILSDRISGIGKYIPLYVNSAEDLQEDANSVQKFLQQGVQVGNMDAVNTANESFVLWQWVANGAGTVDTDGMIKQSDSSTSSITVSANTTAGFSMIEYTGNGSASTIAHGLGATPAFMIVNNITDNATYKPQVYHQALGATKSLTLTEVSQPSPDISYWNDGSPAFGTSTFTVGSSLATNRSAKTFKAYVWAEIEGYSAFGSYTGTGSPDGAVINVGFAPAFLLVKRTNADDNWFLGDIARNTYNPLNKELYANYANAEATQVTFDFLSTGFKARNNFAMLNTSGGNYVYAAFAAHPFGGSGVNQAKAR